MTKILNVKEATKYLRISKPYLYVLLRNDKIESTRIGKRRLFTEEQLDRFVKASKD